ncbi:MAG: hypothetical protein KDC47_07600, partial [Flavobacteriaceae bacterium]|nr:hypothetical protein [Flavobacteriaceae bacterium]
MTIAEDASFTQKILIILGGIIIALTTAQPAVSQYQSVKKFFENRSVATNVLRIRRAIISNQERNWVKGVLNRTIVNQPAVIPIEAQSELLEEIKSNLEKKSKEDTSTTDIGQENLINSLKSFVGDIREFAKDYLKGEKNPSSNKPYDLIKEIEFFDIHDYFKTANGKLVILGAAGSGKTVTAIKLLQYLLNEAKNNEKNYIPVIFNLNSWVQKGLRFEEWMISELVDSFEKRPANAVIKHLTRMVKRRNLIYLFDGLDEIPLSMREKFCSDLMEYSLLGREKPIQFVICSRPVQFESVATKEIFRDVWSISLRAVSDAEIEKYLKGDDYQNIRGYIFEEG